MEALCDLAESVPRLEGVLHHAARSAAPKSTAQALLALGQTEGTVLSILLLVRLHFTQAAPGFSPDPMLARSLRRAMISMQLAQTRDDVSPVNAFVLGLFQDTGSLLLSCRLPHLAAAIEALQHHPGAHRSAAEQLLTGRDHAEELLASPLGDALSEVLKEAISAHHRPDHPLAVLAGAVDAIADVLQVGPGCRPSAEAALHALGSRASLDAILDSAAEATRRLAGIIRLPLLPEADRSLQAQVDALSSLANHGQLTRQLDAALLRSQRGHQSMSVILLNIDRFQLVNEFYGHPAGDLLIRTIAERIGTCTRLSDRLGRLGGDVFCLLLLDTAATGGQVVAERIRSMVERTEIPMGDVRAGCSISLCGVTVASENTIQAARLLEVLETALEVARSQGRNRVRWLDALPETTAISPAGPRSLARAG